MTTLILPEFFDKKLKDAEALYGALKLTITNFRPWLKDSKLPFFEDYTDHGAEHIQEVLATSVELMTNASKRIVSAHDVAIFILSVLLHDAAMHLTKEGFDALINGDAKEQFIDGFDNKNNSWPELWQRYLYSAKRWDERRRNAVFGESVGRELDGKITDPFDHYNNLNKN